MWGWVLAALVVASDGAWKEVRPVARGRLWWRPEVELALKEFSEWSRERGLDAWVSPGAHWILFSATDGADRVHLQSLLTRTQWQFLNDYGSPYLEPGPIVVLHFSNSKDYRDLFLGLRRRYPYLARSAWDPTKWSGFSLFQPRIIAFVENARAPRSTNRDNILVHLAGHSLLHRAAGVQPFWVREAVALDLETSVCRQLLSYCSRRIERRVQVSRSWERQRQEKIRAPGDLEWDRWMTLTPRRLDPRTVLQLLTVSRLWKERPRDFQGFLRALGSAQDANLGEDGTPLAIPDSQDRLFRFYFGERWKEDALERGEPVTGTAPIRSGKGLPSRGVRCAWRARGCRRPRWQGW